MRDVRGGGQSSNNRLSALSCLRVGVILSGRKWQDSTTFEGGEDLDVSRGCVHWCRVSRNFCDL